MKKFLTAFILLVLACFVPIMLSGCDSNKTASQIANEYSTIQTNHSTFFDATTRAFKVEFSGGLINSGMNNQDSHIYSLGKLYMPTLKASMCFVNSKATTFRDCLDKFNQDQLNRVYSGMMRFKSALAEFDTAKKSFDTINKNDGTGYATFLSKMIALIDSALDFNIAFYNGYYDSITAQKDYTTTSFNSEDMKTEVLGGRLYMANILYNRYVKHYSWSKLNSGNVKTFLTKNAYLNSTIDRLAVETISSYADSDKNTLIALRESHNTFVIDMNKVINSIDNFDYTGLYMTSLSLTQFIEDQSQEARSHYYAVEEFLATRFTALHNAIVLLMN